MLKAESMLKAEDMLKAILYQSKKHAKCKHCNHSFSRSTCLQL